MIGGDGTIYATGTSLFAINPDGTEKWHFDLRPAQASVADRGPGRHDLPNFHRRHALRSRFIGSSDGLPKAGDLVEQVQRGNRMQAPITFCLDGTPLVSIRKGGSRMS